MRCTHMLYWVHMKTTKGVNPRIYYALLTLSIVAIFATLPFLLSLDGMASGLAVNPPFLLIGYLLGFSAIYAVIIYLGLVLAKAAGIKLPALEGLTGDKTVAQSVGKFWVDSLILGMIFALIVGVVELLFVNIFDLRIIQNSLDGSLAERILAAFYGAINVEIVMRLFLMSLITFVLLKLNRDKKLGSVGMWTAILTTAVLFGLAQLPGLSSIVEITPIVVIRVLAVYLIANGLFGYLYWKNGLVSAMMAHFAYEITLFVVLPTILMIA